MCFLPSRLILEAGVTLRRRAGQALTLALVLLATAVLPARAEDLPEVTRTQIASLLAEKAARSPAQQKLDCHLHYFAKLARGQAISAAVTTMQAGVKAEADGRMLVDIKAKVTPNLLDFIVAGGGAIVSQVPRFNAIRARLPVAFMESVAGRAEVRFIAPAALPKMRVGSVSGEGDRTHRADLARLRFPTNGGAGIKIGVLSDGVDSLGASIANGNLNANAQAIPGAAGSGDEGTAMMEIIQDIVPNAQLFFATGSGGPAAMANRILALQSAGCTIIVDDVGYATESPFQDQEISTAVQTVSDAGVLYFSAAGNSGSLDKGTSSTWEGNFADGGASTDEPGGARRMDFGGINYNIVKAGAGEVELFWSDPLGASKNDYDVFTYDAQGQLTGSGTNYQSGSEDPFEYVPYVQAGDRIVIVKTAGAAVRFMHLDANEGVLTHATPGSIRGHCTSGAANAFCVAAADVKYAPSPGTFTGGVANPVEFFSSDGPRRMFYQPDGTPITPGNFTSTGGAVLLKPDFTAADGGTTSVAGFSSFHGTSAAAPHAAAIAALLKSSKPSLTPANIRTILASTALDIEGAGFDRDSGSGILDAFAAVQATGVADPLSIVATPLGASGPPGGPFSGTPGTYQLTNNSANSLDWSATKTQGWLDLSPAGGTLAPGASTVVTVSLNATANALSLGVHTDSVTVMNLTSGLTPYYPPALCQLTVQTPQAPTLFDSFTGATLTTVGTAPHTFMGMPFALAARGGASNIKVRSGTVYLIPTTTASYVNVRANITFWGAASGATSGAGPAFSNALGSYAFNLGALSAVANQTYPLNFTLPAAITFPGQIGGVTVNWQGDTGSGLVSTDNLESAIRSGGILTDGSLNLGTANTFGYYRNASGEVDGNFTGDDFKTLGAGLNQGLALRLFGSAQQPVVATNPATNIRATTATLNAAVNPLGSNTTAFIEYGLDTSYGSSAPVVPQPGNGTVAQNVAAAVTGLVNLTTYHFRVVATNGFGTTAGNDQSFITASQPPALTVTASSLAYLENQAATAIDPLLTASNPIGPNLTGGSVAITGNFAGAEDVLGFVNQNNITGSYDPASGVLTLTGTSAVANYQAALRSVTYANLSDTPSGLTRTVTFSVNDGPLGATGSRDVTVTPVNDAPTLTAIPDPPNLLEDSPLQTVALAGLSAGGGETQVLTVTAKSSNPALVPDPVVTYTSLDGTGSLSFTPVANASGTAVITVQVQDDGGTANGGVDTTARTFTVRVFAVNDAPSFLKGANVTAPEDGGPQSITRWATGLKAGPPDESGQALNFLVTVDKPALFSGAPAINSAGTLTFTAAPNANGVATVTVRLHDNGGTANGGVDTSPPQTFTLTIQPSNDSPTFVKGADQVVKQTAGPQMVSAWATALRAGPPDESGQLMDFLVTTDKPALFLTAPAIAPDGTLTFQPDPAAHGVATVTVRLHDDGGVSPGVDTSPPQTFSITTTLVNAAPSFTVGPDLVAGQDAGAQKVTGWAKNISAGKADETGQTLTFQVDVDDSSLFTAGPSVAADGTLTFTPSPTASGTATVTVRLHDDGGLAAGGADTSAPQTFHLAVSTYAEELGAYNGLAVAAGGAPPSHERTGLIKVNVVKTGTCTGSLVLAGHRYTLAGQVDKAGAMTFGHLKAATLDLKRTGASTLSLALSLDVSGGTGQLLGVISDGGAPFSTIEADRAAYTAAAKPVAPLVHVPAELLGRYTVRFAAKTPAELGLAASAFPQGDGVATLTVSTAGVATLVGTLADGAKVSYANALSKTNMWPVYVALASGQGALAGPAHVGERLGLSDADGLDLHWFKPASKAAQYPAGWASGIQLDLLGSKYQVPVAPPAQSVFPNLPPGNPGNFLAAFADGNLPPAGLMDVLNISTADRVTVLPPTSDKLKLTITRSTGLIGGSFFDVTSGKSRTVHAVVFQKRGFGSGYFLGTTESGSISLALPPPATP